MEDRNIAVNCLGRFLTGIVSTYIMVSLLISLTFFMTVGKCVNFLLVCTVKAYCKLYFKDV